MPDATNLIPPDADYTIAEEKFKQALNASADISSHVRRSASLPLKVEAVYITGDPREVIGVAEKTNDRLDIAVKIPGLRGLDEGALRERVLQTLGKQFDTIEMADGRKLSEAFDLAKVPTPAEPGAEPKIRPQIVADTSPEPDLRHGHDILHVLMVLPRDVSHSQVVAALSSEPPAVAAAPEAVTPPAPILIDSFKKSSVESLGDSSVDRAANVPGGAVGLVA